jgi:ATP-dependent DNA helicase RecG
MTTERPQEYLVSLVRELCKLPKETEWVEFKHNNSKLDEIGEYLSALSNSAALCGKSKAYMLWGVDDKTHDIVGTTFVPSQVKKGNEELESWLLRSLSPKIHFRFHEFEVDGKAAVLLEVAQAFRHPVQFMGMEYIRVGSYKKKLKEQPEKERTLWRVFDTTPFELQIAAGNIGTDEVLRLLDYVSYFDLLGLPIPEGHEAILSALVADEMIAPTDAGTWDITNLGAVLFAKRLADFGSLRRKVVRVVVYKGNNRIETEREQEGAKGYAIGFEGLIDYINALLPANEVVGPALREDTRVYPEIAIRELVANALIHQDFFMTGSGPMIEIFEDRMEITNPGKPLVDTDRFLDSPPRSRNERLASFLRRVGVCEERGSGVDKVVFSIEIFQLPAPLFTAPNDFTKAVLFAHKELRDMDREERVRACYLHACLKYVICDYLTNSSLRERFGVEDKNKATVSRYIKEAVEAEMIKPYDEHAAKKLMKYHPFWA